ncbi:hypothetical protein SEA_ARCHIE_125 [Mycobacterium phage Archie]|uniref:Uncharacterized protein n=1 Tax=Mycobacterium phage Archie TaxID=1718599 RepID=A0A0M4RQM4_9CAUD|nr:hypothetical protein AVU85_gp118 [Mycobacterium phage Archie]ALF00419.1 hypothetical protein SEA_ARCHIE_125 [Mycobacterium phage Archie]
MANFGTKCDVCGIEIDLSPSEEDYLTYCFPCFKDLPDD